MYSDSSEESEERGRQLFQNVMANVVAAEQSAPRRRRTIKRGRTEAAIRLYNDYFADVPNYPEDKFRTRYRMSRDLFVRIVNDLENHTPYFTQRYDAAKKLGPSPLQKCTVAVRILAYGYGADAVDDYVKIAETTALQCLDEFCTGVQELYAPVYMRKPNDADVQRLIQMQEEVHGFPGMLGSLDCMHWDWKNFPTAWRGKYKRGDHKYPTIMLEAVASTDLWIWHSFFGVSGSNNDINVLNRSHMFHDKLEGKAPNVQYQVNNKTYKLGYYLTDGIYPEWAAFVKSYAPCQDEKRMTYKKKHEGARKDIERAFGVLRGRFHILREPAQGWDKEKLHNIMNACIILHNMIVDEERHTYLRTFPEEFYSGVLPEDVHMGLPVDFEQFRANDREIRDRRTHVELNKDLVEHFWQRFGITDLTN